MSQIEHLNTALMLLLEETFENVQGIYLDRGTSIFETLSTLTAEEASQPTSSRCASIAAHVEHMTFYIENTLQFIRGDRTQADWNEIWERVKSVSSSEWEASQDRLRGAYYKIRTLIETTQAWTSPNEIGGALGLISHNAYHLGEIRQALCVLKPSR